MLTTLILSDIHFGMAEVPCGRPPRRPEALAPLLHGVDALILNGDTADIHHARRKKDALLLRDAWLSMASRAGISVTLINGNHDDDPGQVDHVELFDGLVFVTHGHAFGDSMLPWTPTHKIIEETLIRARERNPKTLAGYLRSAGEAAMAQWADPAAHNEPNALISIGLNPWRVARVLAWWRTFPREAAAFMDQFCPNAKLLVSGHSHRAGSWLVTAAGGVTARHILNTGGFTFPSSPRAVVIEETPKELSVALRAIRHGQGRYELAPHADASCWRIQRPASATR
ncbi:MAG: hypothetical protein EXS15_07120 [Phycisphaerales bacterium]|nr:hypothetical protein [Phycisphaerales bacterium]